MPERIQLRRTKGWRKPSGAVVVARPTQWGNPWTWPKAGGLVSIWELPQHSVRTRDDSVAAFRDWLHLPDQAELLASVRTELRGKDLACWCPLDQPCHADVLLEVANA
jgi:hypothetical protein